MTRKQFGRFIGVLIVLGALVTGLMVARQVGIHPRTDDAEVFANLIGIAPEVSGRIVAIDVRDNQFVHKGDLLFEIDPLPYRYALEAAQSQQATLEGQIGNMALTIAAQKSAVGAARANTGSTRAKIAATDAALEAAQANIDAARAALSQEEANYAYAENNVLRLEPLLVKQFVTVDMVDQARTLRSARGEAVRQARSGLALAQAQWASAAALRNESRAGYEQSTAQLDQAIKSVTMLEPLTAQRQARTAQVESAAYDLQRCKVYAPFNARVTNLTISEGAYAHAGQQAFTLIDTRTWWVVANFRETELSRLHPGMKVNVYMMSRPDQKFAGTIDGTGFGVTPDASLVGSMSQGLPDVQRSLNWVHLATRFPVRVRIDNPPPDYFRIGASATVIVDGR